MSEANKSLVRLWVEEIFNANRVEVAGDVVARDDPAHRAILQRAAEPLVPRGRREDRRTLGDQGRPEHDAPAWRDSEAGAAGLASGRQRCGVMSG